MRGKDNHYDWKSPTTLFREANQFALISQCQWHEDCPNPVAVTIDFDDESLNVCAEAEAEIDSISERMKE